MDDVWNEQPTSLLLRQNYLGNEKHSLSTVEDFDIYIRSGDQSAWESNAPWFRWQLTIPVETLQSYVNAVDPEAGSLTDVKATKRASGFAVKELSLTCENKTVTVTGEYAIREFLSPYSLPLTNQKEIVADKKVLPSGYFVIDTTKESGALASITLCGGGYGHGAGMSQNAAKAMAEAGMAYRQILAEFFDIS